MVSVPSPIYSTALVPCHVCAQKHSIFSFTCSFLSVLYSTTLTCYLKTTATSTPAVRSLGTWGRTSTSGITRESSVASACSRLKGVSVECRTPGCLAAPQHSPSSSFGLSMVSATSITVGVARTTTCSNGKREPVRGTLRGSS